MSVAIAALLVAPIAAQELATALSTIHSTAPPLPFLDLFPGASNYISDSVRKTYAEPIYGQSICPTYKPDSLSSFASILGSAAKIMLAAAAITFLKVIAGKMLLLPFTVLLFVKMGVKTLLLWPIVAKLIKYLKKKKKLAHKARIALDCSERVTCVLRQSIYGGWVSNLGAAFAFSAIEDVENDSTYASILLNILADAKVAKCMEIACIEGVDIS